MRYPGPKSKSLYVPIIQDGDVEETVEHLSWMFRAGISVTHSEAFCSEDAQWGFRYMLFKEVIQAYARHRVQFPPEGPENVVWSSVAYQTMNDTSTPS